MTSSQVYSVKASALLDMAGHTRKLRLGCKVLDDALGGGLDSHGLTELAGVAGAGKTQLVLQLMLQAMLPPSHGGLGGGAILLHTDSADYSAPMTRLTSLATAFAERHSDLGVRNAMELLERLFVLQIDDHEELWDVVNNRVTPMLAQHQVRLIVLDSIAALFRTSAEEALAAGHSASSRAAHGDRAQQLMRLAARLKQISAQFNVAVVVTNQVTDKPLDARARLSAAPWELGAAVGGDGDAVRVPALGMAWSCCVNTRLLLSRHEAASAPPPPPPSQPQHPLPPGKRARADERAGAEPFDPTDQVEAEPPSAYVRHLQVAWSPRLPARRVGFELRERGLVGVPGSVTTQYDVSR
jgi:RecA/RadA recombinase